MEKAKVFFIKDITPENIVKIYDALQIELPGKVAVKLHSGEEGNQNFLHPEFWRPVVEAVGATVVECNTAYPGARNTTAKHKKLLEKHGRLCIRCDGIVVVTPGKERETQNPPPRRSSTTIRI